jgi:protein ImuB
MRIPSYDDLTPSIPDITPRDTFSQVKRFLPCAPAPAPASHPVADATLSSAPLYACLRADPSPHFDPKTPSPHFVIARDFSPRVERHGGSSVVLDVGGLGRLLGDPQAIGAELDRAAAGSSASLRIAIARTQTAARLLAIGCPGLRVASGEAAAAIAPLPIDALRAFMDDDEAENHGGKVAARVKATTARLDTFRRWGLTSLGDIAALPAADLSERMGQEGLALQQLARGVDRAPLVPDPGVRRFVQSMELEWPIDSLEPLSFVLARLLDPLSLALERADRGAAALRLDLRLVDRTTYGRVLPLPAAIRDAKVLRTLLLLDLESHPPPAAIDIVTIEIDPAPARIVQYSLLERATASPETLATLTARLGALVGERRCGSPSLADTWRPDGFEMRPFSPDSHESQIANRESQIANRESRTANRESRTANREALILRRFRPPVAVRVTVERGRPVRVAIDRRGMPGGHVEQAAGPWRSSGAWWDAPSTVWDRDEWDAALSDGSVCRLFHDRIIDRWFLDGILD